MGVHLPSRRPARQRAPPAQSVLGAHGRLCTRRWQGAKLGCHDSTQTTRQSVDPHAWCFVVLWQTKDEQAEQQGWFGTGSVVARMWLGATGRPCLWWPKCILNCCRG